MKKNYTEEQKLNILNRCRNGECILLIAKETNISRSTIYRWLANSLKKKRKNKSQSLITKRELNQLQHRIQHLEKMFEVIDKTGCHPNSPLKDRLNALEKLYGQYNTYVLCDALKVSRGALYNHLFHNKREAAWYFQHRDRYDRTFRTRG